MDESQMAMTAESFRETHAEAAICGPEFLDLTGPGRQRRARTQAADETSKGAIARQQQGMLRVFFGIDQWLALP